MLCCWNACFIKLLDITDNYEWEIGQLLWGISKCLKAGFLHNWRPTRLHESSFLNYWDIAKWKEGRVSLNVIFQFETRCCIHNQPDRTEGVFKIVFLVAHQHFSVFYSDTIQYTREREVQLLCECEKECPLSHTHKIKCWLAVLHIPPSHWAKFSINQTCRHVAAIAKAVHMIVKCTIEEQMWELVWIQFICNK